MTHSTSYSDDWRFIEWGKLQKIVFRLQRRIFKAVREKDTAKARSCGYCGLKFLTEEKVELHHIDGNHNNWKDDNLSVAHRSCHQYIHMSKS